MARRRKILDDALRFDAPVESEVPAAPIEGEGYDDWLQPQEDSDVGIPISADGPVEAEGPTIERVEPDAASLPTKVGKNYGLWLYRPWKGLDHWVHASGNTSFNEDYVRRLRHLK